MTSLFHRGVEVSFYCWRGNPEPPGRLGKCSITELPLVLEKTFPCLARLLFTLCSCSQLLEDSPAFVLNNSGVDAVTFFLRAAKLYLMSLKGISWHPAGSEKI